MELLVTAQTYGLSQLLSKCIDHVRTRNFTELQRDPHFKRVDQTNLIHILQLRVGDLEATVEQGRRSTNERDARLYGVISELASGYGNFCTECKSRKVRCFDLNIAHLILWVKLLCDETVELRVCYRYYYTFRKLLKTYFFQILCILHTVYMQYI